jgi:hypothetical protein
MRRRHPPPAHRVGLERIPGVKRPLWGRDEFGYDPIAIGDEDCFPARRQAHVLAQTILQNLQSHRSHVHMSSFQDYQRQPLGRTSASDFQPIRVYDTTLQ